MVAEEGSDSLKVNFKQPQRIANNSRELQQKVHYQDSFA